MRALLLRDGELTLTDVPKPDATGECLVRVRLAGICGTDLQLLEGYADFSGVPGHEFVGSVEDAPSRDRRLIGKRVVGEINVGCGRCARCQSGEKEHCESRTVVGIRGRSGAFADYVSLPAANLHVVPDNIDDRAAVFVEPLAAACRIVEQVQIQPQWRVAVVGDGRLGLLVAQVLRFLTDDLVVIGRHDAKLAVASASGLVTRRNESSIGEEFDLVIDTTGRPDGLRTAIQIVRPRGTIVLKSTCHDAQPIALWPVVVKEATIIGSRCGPFDEALKLLARRAIKTDALIAQTFAIADHRAAFAAARHELKVLLDFSR